MPWVKQTIEGGFWCGREKGPWHAPQFLSVAKHLGMLCLLWTKYDGKDGCGIGFVTSFQIGINDTESLHKRVTLDMNVTKSYWLLSKKN